MARSCASKTELKKSELEPLGGDALVGDDGEDRVGEVGGLGMMMMMMMMIEREDIWDLF